jgi:hypothetical protein
MLMQWIAELEPMLRLVYCSISQIDNSGNLLPRASSQLAPENCSSNQKCIVNCTKRQCLGLALVVLVTTSYPVYLSCSKFSQLLPSLVH